MPNSLQWFLIIVIGLPIYFLPALIARRTPDVLKLFLANLFLGWTVITWILLLTFAIRDRSKQKAISKEKESSSAPLG